MRAKRVVALIASVLLALPLATACSSKGNTPGVPTIPPMI